MGVPSLASRQLFSACRLAGTIALAASLAFSPAYLYAQNGASGITPAEAVGMSAERLQRIDTVFERYVAEKRIAGAVALVMRDGRTVHLKSYGKRDVESNTPMTQDSIFRIASMSKAITTAAAMVLVEEGLLLLNDPVSKYLPSFKQTFVAAPPPANSPPDARLGQVPAKRPITIRDIMSQTAGISYGGGALSRDYQAAGFNQWYCADRDETVAQFIDRLATLPFQGQPGEAWVYGFGTDILGRVIEIASGMPLDQFFQTRLFTPLRMTDTYFYLPREKASRLATVYAAQADGTIMRAPDSGRMGQGEYVEGPRKCFSGGAGLVSTVNDYGRFLQMLLNGGELDGTRVLSPAAIASMTSNHVGSLYQNGDLGFGLGFEVIEHVGRAGRLGAQGEFGWSSAYYPRYWVDPENGVVALFLLQLMPNGGLDLQHKFRSLVYQSIIAPGRRDSRGVPVTPVVTSGKKQSAR
ncbi:MAG: serine hydrolase domain-containing protein [Candidatus Korobacteraceae bacterium]